VIIQQLELLVVMNLGKILSGNKKRGPGRPL